jgi:tetratricopeptide (TPR) repeat protein
MTHYDYETLAAYALDRELVDDPGALEAHLAECVSCREEVEAVREFDALSRQPEVWDDAAAIRAGSTKLKEALAERDAIVAEDLRAQRLLAPYLKSPMRLNNKKLADDPRFVTAGAVRVLSAAARSEHEGRPRFSHALAKQACAIVERLPAGHPARAECAVQAHIQRGNALRYLGKFKEADEALAEAERGLPGTPVDDFDLAIIQHVRATVWMESERARQAIPLARAAARTFRRYGDEHRELGALLAEGSCLSLVNEHVSAVGVFDRVVVLARRLGELTLLARAVNNVAASYTAFGDFDRAMAHYAEAIALYEETGMATEQARARWGLAGTLVARGELAAGIDALESVRKELAALALTNDAALATLEWAEARLAAGEPSGVAAACTRVVIAFGSERMERNARIALAFLHEALRTGTATPEIVRHVRLYLEQLPSAPERAFAPLS